MGADSLAENTPNAQNDFGQFNLSAQGEKFGIFEKKLSMGVRSPCARYTYSKLAVALEISLKSKMQMQLWVSESWK